MSVRWKVLLFGVASLMVVGCVSSGKFPSAEVSSSAISASKFLDSPFGHNESIAAFTKSLPAQTSIRKLIRRNTHHPEKSDTIYQFRYRSSEVFVYKSCFGNEILMAGVIANPQIEMANGVVVGISREQLHRALSGIKQSEADTLKISTPEKDRTVSFIFKRGKLRKISFASYYD